MRHTALAILLALAMSSVAQAATVYGIAVDGATQTLVTWDSATPNVILSSVTITGMPTNETIRGMDFDPAYFPGNQRLFAIGAGGGQFANVYRINQFSGITTKLSQLGGPPPEAFGEVFGVDLPRTTSIRSVDDSGHMTGYSTASNSGAGNGTLAYAAGDINVGQTPHLVHLVDNFVIDTNLDVLGSFANFGDPRPVSTIGPLGADFDDAGAIDILLSIGTAFAALQPAGQTQSSFYTLNQQTGAVTLVGPIGNGLLITAMAVEPPLRPVPEPAAAILLAAALLACSRLWSQQ